MKHTHTQHNTLQRSVDITRTQEYFTVSYNNKPLQPAQKSNPDMNTVLIRLPDALFLYFCRVLFMWILRDLQFFCCRDILLRRSWRSSIVSVRIRVSSPYFIVLTQLYYYSPNFDNKGIIRVPSLEKSLYLFNLCNSPLSKYDSVIDTSTL